MPCYQCSHCNKCGMYSRVMEVRCAFCGAAIAPGTSVCSECKKPVRHNMRRGKMTEKK